MLCMKRDAAVREALGKKDDAENPWLDGRLEDDDFTTKNVIPKILTGLRGGLIVAPQPDFFAKTLTNAKDFHDSVTLSSVVYDLIGAGKKFLEFERQKNCVATGLFGGLCDGLGEAFEAIGSGSDFLRLPEETFKRALCLLYESFELAHKWSVENRNYSGTFESWAAKQEGFAKFSAARQDFRVSHRDSVEKVLPQDGAAPEGQGRGEPEEVRSEEEHGTHKPTKSRRCNFLHTSSQLRTGPVAVHGEVCTGARDRGRPRPV